MLCILCFLQMRWNVKDFRNKVIVLMQQVSLYFDTKNARKTSIKKYYTISLLQLLQKKKICERNR